MTKFQKRIIWFNKTSLEIERQKYIKYQHAVKRHQERINNIPWLNFVQMQQQAVWNHEAYLQSTSKLAQLRNVVSDSSKMHWPIF